MRRDALVPARLLSLARAVPRKDRITRTRVAAPSRRTRSASLCLPAYLPVSPLFLPPPPQSPPRSHRHRRAVSSPSPLIIVGGNPIVRSHFSYMYMEEPEAVRQLGQLGHLPAKISPHRSVLPSVRVPAREDDIPEFFRQLLPRWSNSMYKKQRIINLDRGSSGAKRCNLCCLTKC